MDDSSKGDEICSKLFNLTPNGIDKGWKVQGGGGERNSHGVSEEEKLELRLAPPGGEAWPTVVKRGEQPLQSLLSLGYLSKVPKNTSTDASSEAKRVFLGALEAKAEGFQQQSEFLQLQAKGKDLPQNTAGREQQCLEIKACDPSAPHASTVGNATTANNAITSRTATGPVVGWPPIRSFRKNLASTSKLSLEPQNGIPDSGEKQENIMKGLFVKINMDGIPIGRKVDLRAYDSYDKLSLAVDQLFRGLLAAQKDPLAAGSQNIVEEKHVITGLLDGSGEYTLVYEDDEGDRMLVGDVPWDMFVSTAKRLRVLKSSELAASTLVAISRKRMAT